MKQVSSFHPGSGNREDVQTRLLHRKTDPPTSRQAANRTVKRGSVGRSRGIFLNMLRIYEGLTCKEAAIRFMPGQWNYWQVEWDKRVKVWARQGHIRETGEVRDGSRVWSAT